MSVGIRAATWVQLHGQSCPDIAIGVAVAREVGNEREELGSVFAARVHARGRDSKQLGVLDGQAAARCSVHEGAARVAA